MTRQSKPYKADAADAELLRRVALVYERRRDAAYQRAQEDYARQLEAIRAAIQSAADQIDALPLPEETND